MDKAEFLSILRQALDMEVSKEIIDQNISFYDQYIGSRSKEDEINVINEIGDPRLIAKTIIEKEKMTKQKELNINSQSYQDSNYEENQRMNNENDQSKFGKNIFFTNLKWYHKLIMAAVILLFLIILIGLGRIIFAILFTFAVPILIISIIFMLFRRR